jgi:hypothetical protein
MPTGICPEVFDADPDDLDTDGWGGDPFENDSGGD